jgi:Cdc6-like AAA superfamily ATPase
MPKPAHFTIERRSDLELKAPDFLCDKCIHPQITAPLPHTAHAMLICGAPGSGKTSMMVSLLQSKQAYKKAFDQVFVVMPPSSARSLKNNIFEKHNRMYDDLTSDTLEQILEQTRKSTKENKNSLVVIDDFGAALKDGEIQRQLKELIWNRRHLRTSVWIMLQSYISAPLQLRKAVSHLVTYKPRNKLEFLKIFEELIQLPKETAEDLMRYVYDKKYAFLFADCSTGEVFKNFDLIRINDDG